MIDESAQGITQQELIVQRSRTPKRNSCFIHLISFHACEFLPMKWSGVCSHKRSIRDEINDFWAQSNTPNWWVSLIDRLVRIEVLVIQLLSVIFDNTCDCNTINAWNPNIEFDLMKFWFHLYAYEFFFQKSSQCFWSITYWLIYVDIKIFQKIKKGFKGMLPVISPSIFCSSCNNAPSFDEKQEQNDGEKNNEWMINMTEGIWLWVWFQLW